MVSDFKERLRLTVGESMPHFLDGDPAKFRFGLLGATLRSGDSIAFTPGGVTAVVGGNNVGKSTLLVEVVNHLAQQTGQPRQPSLVVESVSTEKMGEQRDAIAWLGQHATFVGDASNPGFLRPGAGQQHPAQLVSCWASLAGEVGPINAFLCFYANAQARFGMGGSAEMRDSHTDPSTHPVHALQDSRELMAELNGASTEIFGTPLVLDNLGRSLRLRVGSLDVPAPPIDDITQAYRDAMASLPMLDQQGDGMRSMFGLLLPLITATYPLIVIDEPEAFLHPPQAHALGRQLGALATSKGVQVVVATHDKDFLAGLLESNAPVSVVRVTRDADGVRAHQLPEDKVRELWVDPVLRYTNVLDGLFHQLVVLAEAEGDCSYLAAALDHPDEARPPELKVPRNEVLFLPTGGKDGMTKVAKALSAVKVPMVAAPDLDALADKSKLEGLVSAIGGQWTEEMDRLHLKATIDLRTTGDAVKVGHVLDGLVALLEPRKADNFTTEVRDLVRAQTRAGAGPWSEVKTYGIAAFKGEASPAVRELIDLLDAEGFVVVKEGELECLAPEVAARKGPGWLAAALEAGSQGNAQTQAHIRRILQAGIGRKP